MTIPLNDISSDLEQPPVFFVAPPQNPVFDLERLKLPIRKAYEDLQNLELPFSTAEAFGLVRLLVSERGWKVVGQDDEGHRIQAVATTLLLRFKDDVVIEVRPRSGGAIVAMRSKSRLGKSDLGANARRIRKFFRDL